MINKLLAAAMIAVAVFGTNVAQATVDTSGLDAAQIAQLRANAANMIAETAKSNAMPGGDKVSQAITIAGTWGEQASQAAEGFARAITIAAKELGITVNDFLQTDAGKLTAILIIWKVAGASILSAVTAVVFVAVGLIVATNIYRRLFTKGYQAVQYSRLFGMFTGTKMVRVPKTISDLETGGEWLAFWMVILVTFGSLMIGTNIIA